MKLFNLNDTEDTHNQIGTIRQSAVALGCFDGVHLGHAALLKAAKLNGKELDTAVFSFFGNGAKNSSEITTLDERLAIITEIGINKAAIYEFDEVKNLSPREFVKKILIDELNCKIAYCGFNFKFGKNAEGDGEKLASLMREFGGECVVVPAVMHGEVPVSSAGIRKAIESGDMKSAAQMLGRDYSLSLPVIHGQGIGEKNFGIPTINQEIPKNRVMPKFGVYKTVCEFGGKRFNSASYIGTRPTVGGTEPVLETHIPGFSGDLYGETVKVFFREFLRPEIKFGRIDELADKMKEDLVN